MGWLGKLNKTGVVGWFAPDLVVPLDEQQQAQQAQITPQQAPQSSAKQEEAKPFSFSEEENHNQVSAAVAKHPASPSRKPKKIGKGKGKGKDKSKSPKGKKGKKTPTQSPATSPATSPGVSASSKAFSKPAPPSKRKDKDKGAQKRAKSPARKKGKDKVKEKAKAKDDDSKVDVAEEPAVVIPYARLKAKQFGDVAVEKTKLEKYLSNGEFEELFKMTCAEFRAKPGWKQRALKKDKGLF